MKPSVSKELHTKLSKSPMLSMADFSATGISSKVLARRATQKLKAAARANRNDKKEASRAMYATSSDFYRTTPNQVLQQMLETKSDYEANKKICNFNHVQPHAKDIKPETYGIDKRLIEPTFNNMTASKKALDVAENAKDLKLNRFKMTKNGKIEEHIEPIPRVANRLGKSQDFNSMPGRLTSKGPLNKLKTPLKPVDIISN